MRQLVDLKRATLLPGRPTCIPVGRLRGTKAKGIAFEREVYAALPRSAKHGPWYSFFDANGPGYCQPDIIVVGKEQIAVFEVKLSNIEEAIKQLSNLYLPVVSKAHGKKAIGIIVVRHLTRVPIALTVCSSVKEAVQFALRGGAQHPVVHWLGHGPLV